MLISGYAFSKALLEDFTIFGLLLDTYWTPDGTLFRGISGFIQDRCKSRLQGAKRDTFSSILGTIWHDLGYILEDLGCTLNTPFLGMP